METSSRAILPRGELPTDHPELERDTQSAPAELDGGGGGNKRKRKLTLSACEACRKRKIKCDGNRPTCSACLHKISGVCTWEVKDASLSRMAALRHRVDELEHQLVHERAKLKGAADLAGYLMNRPERESQNILKRLRETENIAATVQFVRDGDLLISSEITSDLIVDRSGPLVTG